MVLRVLLLQDWYGTHHIGEVSYFKVMSGSIKNGDDLTNADRGSKERIGQIYACAGANRVPVEQLNAGDIGCTVKMKDVKTGNTLNGKGLSGVSTSLNILTLSIHVLSRLPMFRIQRN